MSTWLPRLMNSLPPFAVTDVVTIALGFSFGRVPVAARRRWNPNSSRITAISWGALTVERGVAMTFILAHAVESNIHLGITIPESFGIKHTKTRLPAESLRI